MYVAAVPSLLMERICLSTRWHINSYLMEHFSRFTVNSGTMSSQEPHQTQFSMPINFHKWDLSGWSNASMGCPRSESQYAGLGQEISSGFAFESLFPSSFSGLHTEHQKSIYYLNFKENLDSFITSRVSGRGYRNGPVCVSVCGHSHSWTIWYIASP